MKQTLAHGAVVGSSPVFTTGWARLLLLASLLTLTGILRGSDLPAPVTIDLPVPDNLATPTWLGHPVTTESAFPSLNLPVLTPDTKASLLVTVYFKEKTGGFLRIIWNGTQGAQTLSDNFYENISMENQRSLVVSSATLIGDGTLSFQAGDSTLGIERIKLEWLETRDALVSPAVGGMLVTPSTLPTQAAINLSGQTIATQPGMWIDQVVTVPITDAPLRIEQGVEFTIDLDKVPTSARLALKETGLPLGKRLVAWVNGTRAGSITPGVPDLLDSGFLADTSDKINYVGWRDGSFYVPVKLLKSGDNAIQFSDEDDASPDSTLTSAQAVGRPLAVKAMTMQLNYAPVQSQAGFQPPKLLLLPAGPIPPWKHDPAFN